jgi:sarcosine oxidase
METFDAIVVGLGAHGSAAALARRGQRVLGLERFGRGEALGSSGEHSRMIRLAHYESPRYAPLAAAAWDRWLELEREASAELLTVTGGLYAGPTSSPVVAGVMTTAGAHVLAHEVIDADAIGRRLPAFAPSEDTIGRTTPISGSPSVAGRTSGSTPALSTGVRQMGAASRSRPTTPFSGRRSSS